MALWVAIGLTIGAFFPISRAAGWLLAPYLAWVSFAAVLNGSRAIQAFGDHEPHTDTQPINFARADAPPILLQTGTADITVRARNSQQLARALEEEGADVELKFYRGATHTDPVKAFSPIFSRFTVVDDLVDWLNAKLA